MTDTGGLSLERIQTGERYFVTSAPDRHTVWDDSRRPASPVSHFPSGWDGRQNAIREFHRLEALPPSEEPQPIAEHSRLSSPEPNQGEDRWAEIPAASLVRASPDGWSVASLCAGLLAAALAGVPLGLRGLGTAFASTSAGLGLVLYPFALGFGLAGLILWNVASGRAENGGWAWMGALLSITAIVAGGINAWALVRVIQGPGDFISPIP